MIDFELSEEQQMIRDSVGAFAREEIRPAARPADESGTIPAALISKAWQFGFVSGAIPEKFGGGGAYEHLESIFIDCIALVEINRAAGVAFKAGVEQL